MRRQLAWVVLALIAIAPLAAWPRVGGGQSYSGSRSSSSPSRSSSSASSSGSSRSSWSGSSGSSSRSSYSGSSYSGSSYSGSSDGGGIGGFFGALVMMAVLGFALYYVGQMVGSSKTVYLSSAPPAQTTTEATPAEELQAFDPTFSEPVFLEWATLLFMRGQKSRGGAAEVLSPWFDDLRTALPPAIDGRPVGEVLGVVVGNARLAELRREPDVSRLDVSFRACLTTRTPRGDQAWYLEETWTFRRAAGVRSRTPDDIEKVACPACGSPFERDPMGSCPSCNQELRPGLQDWSVEHVARAPAQTRPPLLTGEVEEQGTAAPSVRSPTLGRDRQKLSATSPFNWQDFDGRARAIFLALQQGWTEQKWEALRPLETENVFGSHRFWIEEYRRQGLRNRLEDVKLARVEVVKVSVDACYESITCRMYASMRDSTVRVADGAVVAGNASKTRPFTEYWTFLRRPGATPKAGATQVQCPSCGAPQKISQAGVCEYCQAKVTSGQFGWVLSRIDQDEEYQG